MTITISDTIALSMTPELYLWLSHSTVAGFWPNISVWQWAPWIQSVVESFQWYSTSYPHFMNGHWPKMLFPVLSSQMAARSVSSSTIPGFASPSLCPLLLVERAGLLKCFEAFRWDVVCYLPLLCGLIPAGSSSSRRAAVALRTR